MFECHYQRLPLTSLLEDSDENRRPGRPKHFNNGQRQRSKLKVEVLLEKQTT